MIVVITMTYMHSVCSWLNCPLFQIDLRPLVTADDARDVVDMMKVRACGCHFISQGLFITLGVGAGSII